MPALIRPGLTDREAVLNSSAEWVENCVYLFWSQVRPSMNRAKIPPIPITMP